MALPRILWANRSYREKIFWFLPREGCLWMDANEAGACSLSLCVCIFALVVDSLLPPKNIILLYTTPSYERKLIHESFAASPSLFEAIRSRLGLMTGGLDWYAQSRNLSLLTRVLRTIYTYPPRSIGSPLLCSYFAQRFIQTWKPTVRGKVAYLPITIALNIHTYVVCVKSPRGPDNITCNSVRMRIAYYCLGGSSKVMEGPRFSRSLIETYNSCRFCRSTVDTEHESGTMRARTVWVIHRSRFVTWAMLRCRTYYYTYRVCMYIY